MSFETGIKTMRRVLTKFMDAYKDGHLAVAELQVKKAENLAAWLEENYRTAMESDHLNRAIFEAEHVRVRLAKVLLKARNYDARM